MKFIEPYYLWLLLLLPVVGWLLFRIMERSEIVFSRFFGSNVSGYFPRVRFIVGVLGFASVTFACTGPYLLVNDQYISNRQKEVYFLLDVSASMNAQDVQPTRLQKSKEIIQKVSHQLRGEKLGLIAFTDYAYVQCPLTKDLSMFNLFLEILETKQFGNKGTNFRKAISQALSRFSIDSRRETNKSIVLLSDGENYSESFHSVLLKLKNEQVNFICVGVGTKSGAPIPNNLAGIKGETPFITDENGQQVITRLNDVSFKEINKEMRGGYFVQNTNNNVSNDVLSRLNRVTASAADQVIVRQSNDLFYWFLTGGIICWTVFLFLIPFKKKEERLHNN